jgi:hypothetical protein
MAKPGFIANRYPSFALQLLIHDGHSRRCPVVIRVERAVRRDFHFPTYCDVIHCGAQVTSWLNMRIFSDGNTCMPPGLNERISVHLDPVTEIDCASLLISEDNHSVAQIDVPAETHTGMAKRRRCRDETARIETG